MLCIKLTCISRWFAMMACVLLSIVVFSVMDIAYANEVVCFSPNGKLVANANDGGGLEVRSTLKTSAVVTLQHEGVPSSGERELSALSWVPSFLFSPDGKTIASVCGGLPVTLWDVASGKKLRNFGYGGDGQRLLFSPDGSRLIGYGLVNKAGMQRLTLWDVESAEKLREITVERCIGAEGWDREAIRPKFAKAGPWLVIEVIDGTDRSLKVWDTTSNQERLSVKINTTYGADWAIASDGRYLVVRDYSDNGTSVDSHRLFELAGGKVVKEWGTSAAAKNE